MAGEAKDGTLESTVLASNPMGLPLKELRRLKDQFQDEEGQPRKLDEEHFVKALLSRISTAQAERRWDTELRTLFKKIDASCSESVTWEEFTNYMLFHAPGFNSSDGACELSHNAAAAEALAGAWQCGHADMINSIAVVNDFASGTGTTGAGSSTGSGGARRYITAGRDGFVKVWHPNLTLHKEIDVGQTSSWLSSCCWMQRSRKLAVASSSFRIFFYDNSLSPITHIDHKEGTPLCLGYTDSHENKSSEKEILMVGDDKGYVTVYPLDANDWVDQEPKTEGDAPNVKKMSRKQYHKDWVTKVGFVSQLQAMVTCSLDGEINVCDVHTNQRKENRDAVRLHKKGVHSWCWCANYKFFASGGSDRQIIIWNPYTQKAMNYLQGHNAPVLDVLVNEKQHQLISMSVDKVVKVWDILNYQCIQTFTDKTEYKPEDRLTCMAFDEEGPALVLGSSLINVLPVSVKVQTSRTHLAPIVGALHNDVFHQIISGDNTGTVSVWDIETGKLEFEFRRAHQDHKMTCMVFDESKRCLYTGGEDGCVKLWNFSSGQQLRSFTMRRPSEIRSLLWAQEGPNTFVVGLAWDRRIYIWPDSKKQQVEPQYVLEDFTGHGHTDDVTCLSRLSSVTGLLATGGDDGYVCFWKIQETAAGGGASSRRYRLFDTSHSQAPETNVPSTEGTSDRRRNKKGVAQGDLPPAGKRVSHAAAPPQGYPDSPTSSLPGEEREEEWPEEYERRCRVAMHLMEDLTGSDKDTGLASCGVEHTIFLEQKECLLTIHADQMARLWSTKQAEFLGKVVFMEESPEEAAGVAPVQQESITAVYASKDNAWLFTGDANGWVRIWDLSTIRVDSCPSHLLRMKEMQLHRMAVTSLQHFKMAGNVVIVTASADWTVALHTMDGTRIGNFSHRGKEWRISDTATWCDQPPSAKEGIRGPEEDDDRWGSISPRRPGMGGAGARREGGAANGGGMPGMGVGVGMRTPRGSKVRTRPVIAPPVHSGQGDFGKLSVVERFKPDLTLAEQEKQRLSKLAVSDRDAQPRFGGILRRK